MHSVLLQVIVSQTLFMNVFLAEKLLKILSKYLTISDLEMEVKQSLALKQQIFLPGSEHGQQLKGSEKEVAFLLVGQKAKVFCYGSKQNSKWSIYDFAQMS